MKRSHLASFAMLLALVLLGSLAWAQVPTREFAPTQKGQVEFGEQIEIYRPGRLVVQFSQEYAEDVAVSAEEMHRGAGPLQTGIAGVDQAIASFNLRSLSPLLVNQPLNRMLAADTGTDRWYVMDFGRDGDMEALARTLEREPGIESANPDYRAFPAAVPNDPLNSAHWGHNNTAQLPDLDWGGTYDHTLPNTVGTVGFDANAQAAWDLGYGDSGVIIAIIDSGVDTSHPDLRLVAGYDYGDNDSNPTDNSAQAGHGTACAGVAASINNNGIGAAGIAGGVSVMPLKVANSAGSMYFSAIVNAIYHAADHGADVISMSLGAAISSDPATNAALQYAFNAGVTILAATGNENVSTISYPAINQYVIAVGAASPCGERKRSSSSSSETNPGVSTDPHGYTCDGERWWGSNYGSNSQGAASAVDILGPTILPTTDITGSGGYSSGNYSNFFNGTSCATPYVAGVAALVKSHNPSWTATQVRDRLRSTAQDVTSVESGSGWDRYAGYGMVDAAAAVGSGGTPTPPTAEFTGTPTSGNFPLNVQFADASSGSPTSWSWNFGDGGNSSAQNPSHTYTSAGNFTVSLTATNAQGSDGETKTAYITVSDPAESYANLPYSSGFESGSLDQFWTAIEGVEGRIQVTTANGPHSGSYHLTMDDEVNGGAYSQNEAWLQLNLAGQGTVDLDFWYKEFGDETHAQDGVFFSDNGGASFTKVYDISGGSTADNTWFNVQLDVDALAGSAGLSLTSTFVIKFQQYDNYAINSDGFCFDDIEVTGGASGNPPTAEFTANTTNGTAPLSVNFTDQSTDVPTAWTWNFGDGNGSNVQNPSHNYTSAGTYTVTLTASNAFGADAEVKTDYITVTGGGGTWESIAFSNFESGWQSWTDGGSDCQRSSADAAFAHQGTYCVRLRDDSSTSVVTSPVHNLTGYAELEVDFWYRAESMDNNNEGFLLQYYNGSSWQTIDSWYRGADFQNGEFHNATVNITSSSYNFASNARLRFVCDGSGNSDWVYIDEVAINGFTVGGSGIEFADGQVMPRETGLRQNFPNPFNPITNIEFALPQAERVQLSIFDLRGRRVVTLADGNYEPGVHSVRWDASQVASGVYFYQLRAGSFVETKKMTLVK